MRAVGASMRGVQLYEFGRFRVGGDGLEEENALDPPHRIARDSSHRRWGVGAYGSHLSRSEPHECYMTTRRS